MFTARRRLLGFVRLALAAMLTMSLLPTLARALDLAQRTHSSSLAEICMPQGLQQVLLDAAPSDRLPGAVDHLQDCPYCARASSMAALLPPALQLPLPPPADGARPALFRHAPRTLFTWASAQPRGPPRTV